ncbi:MAG: hypothetical protein KA715_00830 [Xanthomonadaceae bacterium]|nr:hypothetical protein [Xanthomonadaceae bacterium]
MNQLDRVSTYSGLLVSAEVGLGAWIHALGLPLGGQLLSLNQGFLLSFAARNLSRGDSCDAAYGVSTVAAVLKSLSPLGKRLTPMLAIWVQGVLFSLGVFLGGAGLFGVSLGMVLLSTWSFIQPILLAMLIFGVDPLVEWTKLFPQFSQSIIWIILAFVVLKCLIAVVVAWLALKLPEQKINQFLSSLSTWRIKKKYSKVKWVWILGSFTMGLALFFIHGESNVQYFVKFVMRPLAMSLFLFWGTGWLLSRVDFEKLLQRFPFISAALSRVKRDLTSSN